MSSIKINVSDLLEKLSGMVEEDFSNAELEIEESMIEEDSLLRVYAFDPVTGTRTEYGDIPYDSGEIL